ncbi:MAG TPA: YHS domain-containing protein [Candidatus Nanoarchaeia archaeon]|nr:YHS domain-containing protein [Candidatus Nanoarchaeia archaeon]
MEGLAKFKLEFKGKTCYFCAFSCKNTFDKNPAKYTKA